MKKSITEFVVALTLTLFGASVSAQTMQEWDQVGITHLNREPAQVCYHSSGHEVVIVSVYDSVTKGSTTRKVFL